MRIEHDALEFLKEIIPDVQLERIAEHDVFLRTHVLADRRIRIAVELLQECERIS